MFLIARNLDKNFLEVFEATPDDVDNFEANADQTISGWAVGRPEDVADTSLSNKELVALYNRQADKPLVKFQNRSDASARTFEILGRIAKPFEDLLPTKAKVKKAPKKTKKPAKKKAASTTRQNKGIISLDPKESIYPCREGTRQADLVDYLARGATMEELRAATSGDDPKKGTKARKDWTDTSIRSGLYWDVNRVKGYGIKTIIKTEAQLEESGHVFNKKDAMPDGRYAFYKLTYPAGHAKPLPHTGKKS